MPLLPSFDRSFTPRGRRASGLLALASLIALTAGCASAPAHSNPDAGDAAAPAVTDNCGVEVALDHPPQRVVTIKSTTTELLLALGLGDRIVGAAFLDGPVPEQWADDAAGIPVISDFAPSQEAVLDLEPDFVFAGWESNLTADAAGERATLASFGVGTYVAPSACKAPEYKPEKLTFDVLFDEIAEAGDVFGAETEAAELIDQQRERLADIEPSTAGLTALWYSSGSDTPYVGAGIGAPQLVMETAGLENIAAGIEDTWTSLGWESVIEADPDVIVLVDASWNTAAKKIELLKSNPVTAELTAVRRDRFVVVPFAAGEAGVRSVEAVASVVAQLGELGIG
ncbi:putative F420-0 ABC transporter substrate-binding protein [Ruicaihuangia caeni]|uniref:F420-0 ABC transporter substrate-binding protein n=1 Tax=Ruicaihuangia caeni TaxID=3042517 RepID=A0AAW6T2M5_9MICO|nr:putative F420-0 ABC transporter substrate-binding protein [Klugiella sp. YN-L-19]MDI2097679.1 putative F420-0 ABC transporter substrate-binding protein [Klugiella sp. YN-L-19]